MNKEAYNTNAQETLNTLAKGAFLTTQYAGQINTMTIAWGSIGFIWGKPVFMAMVRKSRFTHELLSSSGEFTVTIPKHEAGQDDIQKALNFCGANSGRKINKLQALGLKTIPGIQTEAPIIDCKGLHYECMVLFHTDMSGKNLDKITDDKWYSDRDYHTLFFGEIVNTILR